MNKFMKQCINLMKNKKKKVHKTCRKIANTGSDHIRFLRIAGVGSGNKRKRIWG